MKYIDILTQFFIEEHEKMQEQELKDAVTKLLITDYEFLTDEAEEAVTESSADNPGMWSAEGATPETIAFSIASDEDSE